MKVTTKWRNLQTVYTLGKFKYDVKMEGRAPGRVQ
jgi:hypothetical protein